MSENETFLEQVLAGTRLASEIDDAVEDWHSGDSNASLRETLGFKEDEYDLWLSSPSFFDLIVFARATGHTLQEVANDNFLEERRMAARAEDSWMVNKLKAWLANNSDG